MPLLTKLTCCCCCRIVPMYVSVYFPVIFVFFNNFCPHCKHSFFIFNFPCNNQHFFLQQLFPKKNEAKFFKIPPPEKLATSPGEATINRESAPSPKTPTSCSKNDMGLDLICNGRETKCMVYNFQRVSINRRSRAWQRNTP